MLGLLGHSQMQKEGQYLAPFHRTSVIGLLSLLLGGITYGEDSIEPWYLMSRHGDCSEIETLKRKIPDMPEINDPVSFIEHVKDGGYSVSYELLPVPTGEAYQVDIVELSLNLIFVHESMCTNDHAYD